MDVIASLQSAIDIVSKLRDLSKKVEDADFKMLLADLSMELADAKLEMANLKVSLATTIEENEKLKASLAQKNSAKPKLVNGAYAFEGEDGAFCTACWDTKQQHVRVTEQSGAFRRFGKWRCPSCQATFG
jgi:septal ring factor EnvC (AmiA/AmiB activator)